ncbi:MAG: acyltransferase [Terracidiphilus sp.]|nr:acyltransferase [Terracidiphilus sp.]
MTNRYRRYIPTLDGWRAIAIILVVFCHDEVHRIGPISSSWLTEHGGTGVNVFFAISGMLICTLLLDEEQESGSISLRQFYVRRAFRILPAATTYLVVIGLLGAFGVIAVRGIDWLGSLFFFRNYLPNDPSVWYTCHFWSLSVEEHFYLLLPGFLVLFRKHRQQVLLFVGISVLIAFSIAKRSRFFTDRTALDWSDFTLAGLLIAAAAAVYLRQPRLALAASRLLKPLPIIILVVAVITLDKFETILVPFLMVALVSSTILNPSSAVAALLESRPLRFIGKRSYSLYLWQQLFMTAQMRSKSMDFLLQIWPLSILAAFTCACLSYSLIEKPSIEFGRRILRHHMLLKDREKDLQPSL